MVTIGLTGGIASGKTAVTWDLIDIGAPVIDADEISRSLTAPGGPALSAIRERFGVEVFNDKGELIRSKLAAAIFTDPTDTAGRLALENILHPIIFRHTEETLSAFKARGERAAIVSAPLLIESGMQRLVNEIWVMYVPKEEQLRRVIERDGLTLAQAEARLASQMPFARKARLADVIIPSTGSRSATREIALRQWRRILTGSLP